MTPETNIRPKGDTMTAEPAASPQGRNMVTIASGKGGVGKTWLSITLANALARMGRKALLFDGDFGLANVDIQLGLAPGRDLGTVIGQGMPIASAITRYQTGGFDIIAGKSGSGALAALGRPQVAALRDDLVALSAGYDFVLVDVGAGVDSVQTTLSNHAGITLVVTTDEPTSLTDAYAFIKVAAMRRHRPNLAIVVNMAASRTEGLHTYETLRRACDGFLKLSPPLAAVIRRDPKVRDAIRHQTALFSRHPTSEAARSVEGLARFVTERR
jgi:flagellar biosynthesis protein FlhG